MTDTDIQLTSLLQVQQQAHLAAPFPAAEARCDRIDRLIALVLENIDALNEAVDSDFGCRSADNTNVSDHMAIVAAAKHAKNLVPTIMRPEKRKTAFPMNLLGARCSIQHTPLGVVGNVSPWNFPVGLSLQPLADIFAAGNRCMLKPSELTPNTSALLAELAAKYFDASEFTVVQGGPKVAAAFTKLPFDHLLFTGSTNIARHVMASAAPNLTPVTLELGGKSPTIVSNTAKLEETAAKIMFGKTLNGGQICLAPDYALVVEQRLEEFVQACKAAAAQMYPNWENNPDFTSIITQRHYDRLCDLVAEAESRECEVIPLAGNNQKGKKNCKFTPTLIKNAPLDARVMQEELFGPILPIITYTDYQQVIDLINSRPHPLAIYYFGSDQQELDRTIRDTRCGGMTINDVIFHVGQNELPFGGVGESGMGYYHGLEGLKNFSHAKAIYKQAGIDIGKTFRPPYTNKFRKMIQGQLKP